MKYVILVILIVLGLLAYLAPQPGPQIYTAQELRYGKMPRNFAYDVRRGFKERNQTVINVKCYSVVVSEKYDGWLSACSYKQKGANDMWHLENKRFVINYKKSMIDIID